MAEGTHANNLGLPPEKIAASRPNRRTRPGRSWWPDKSRYVSCECNTFHTGVTTIGLDSSDTSSLDAHDPRGAGEVEGDVLKCH